MKYEIKTRQAYHETMVAIYNLMNKGEANLSADELIQLSKMSLAVEKYEDDVLGLQPKKEPETISELVQLKLFEHKMTQAKLAEELGIGKSKMSEILSGKRKPDVDFLKGVYKLLKINAEFLLEHA